jgi:tetratricopeptide (TPR) repeat protein
VTRTGRRKAVYFGIVGFGATAVTWVVFHYHLSVLQFSVLLLLMLLPGRILGYFWRDLLIGLRLLKEKQFEESVRHSRRFLDQVGKRPWIKRLIWLGSGTYSRDPEALALNNLGAAEMCMGHFESAEEYLRRSIVIDDENPLPYFNLARLYLLLEDPVRANEYLSEARRRGYTGGLSDSLIRAAQNRFAHTDGRGTSEKFDESA